MKGFLIFWNFSKINSSYILSSLNFYFLQVNIGGARGCWLGHKVEIIGIFPRSLYMKSKCTLLRARKNKGTERVCAGLHSVSCRPLRPPQDWNNKIHLGYISSLICLWATTTKKVENLSWTRGRELHTQERGTNHLIVYENKSLIKDYRKRHVSNKAVFLFPAQIITLWTK